MFRTGMIIFGFIDYGKCVISSVICDVLSDVFDKSLAYRVESSSSAEEQQQAGGEGSSPWRGP